MPVDQGRHVLTKASFFFLMIDVVGYHVGGGGQPSTYLVYLVLCASVPGFTGAVRLPLSELVEPYVHPMCTIDIFETA